MDAKTKRSVMGKIRQVAKNAGSPNQPQSVVQHFRVLIQEAMQFSLADAAAFEFEDVCAQLLQERAWSAKFSESYVENAVERVIAKLLKDGHAKNAEAYLDQLIAEFDSYASEWQVYLVLSGIHMQVDSLQVGRVVLRRMAQKQADEIVAKVEAIGKLSADPEDIQREAVQVTRLDVNAAFVNVTCAEFTAVAEPDRLRERAEEECRRILDLFRFCIPALIPEGYVVQVGLQDDVRQSMRIVPIFSTDGTSYTWIKRRTGPTAPFVVSQASIAEMSRLGIFEMAKVLEKPEDSRTDFEETIIRGIHWFANAQTQVERENELLSLVTCLETFLTPAGTEPIATAVAEGLAILVFDDLENRKRLKRRIKDVYGKRSRVSHGGRKAVLDADLNDLREIAWHLTAHMIQRKDEFRTKSELLDWIEDQRLG